MAKKTSDVLHTPEDEWMAFPGGELEGKRPRRLCPDCRDALRSAPAAAAARATQPLCFRCYRLALDRDRALEAAAAADTASDARFQEGLPFEPVDHARLSMLKVERAAARVVSYAGAGQFAARRRQAQMAARHALQAIGDGLKQREVSHAARDRAGGPGPAASADRLFADAVRAAELQLPASWLPFVVSG